MVVRELKEETGYDVEVQTMAMDVHEPVMSWLTTTARCANSPRSPSAPGLWAGRLVRAASSEVVRVRPGGSIPWICTRVCAYYESDTHLREG